jgi:hypothetical protein
MRSNAALSALLRASATKLCAWCLSVLVVLPFTAPFAAINFADVIGGARTQTLTEKVVVPASAAEHENADDAAAPDVYVQRVHPMASRHLLPIASPSAGDTPASAGRSVIAPAATLFAHGTSSIALALRL